MAQKYNVLIIDPNPITRARLREAIRCLKEFGEIIIARDPVVALDMVPPEKKCDLVFIAYTFDERMVADFIRRGKQTRRVEDAAYILVLSAKDQGQATVVRNIMEGADGFLFEPFSLDSLLELARIADRVKIKRAAERQKVALAYLVREILDQIDIIAELKSCGYQAAISRKNLSEMCSVLPKLDGELKDQYFSMVLKTAMESPKPKEKYKDKVYRGASLELKRRTERKIVAELQQESQSRRLFKFASN